MQWTRSIPRTSLASGSRFSRVRVEASQLTMLIKRNLSINTPYSSVSEFTSQRYLI